MGGEKILIGAEWHDAGRVNVIMRDVVVACDMIEINCVGNPFLLIEIFEISEEIGIIHNAPDVAFEMSMMDRIKSNERHEQAPIRFDKTLTKEISLAGKSFFHEVQRIKQLCDSVCAKTEL